MGKERSNFTFSVEKVDEVDKSFEFKFEDKIYFESDVYLSNIQIEKINKIIDFKITDEISFRNLKWKDNKYLYNDVKNSFFKRGTIIYVENKFKEEVLSIIRENSNLVNIGYNTVS